MNPEQWKRVERIYHSALECEPAERADFLRKACAGDDALRSEVESLLAYEEQAQQFIELPALELVAKGMIEDQATRMEGRQFNSYRIISRLGAGGMGEVYLAKDSRLGRRVALKLLPSQFTQDKQRLERFKLEARAASALNHPNILTIHVIGDAEGSPFIATEFIEGVTLRQRMADSQMKLSEALDVAIQVASALSAAHQAGIVHRDIKPENIMIRQDGYVKVLDFGLAKLTEQQVSDSESTMVKTDEGIVMGTARYMSPEQARGQSVDARTDIWSLGVVLYEMVTGRAPFEGATPGDVIVSILEREPQPLARSEAEAPVELDWMVKKALRKDRDERYQTAKEVLSDLKSLKHRLEFEAELERSGQPVTNGRAEVRTSGGVRAIITAASRAEYLVSQIKRHKRVTIIALAVVLIALAGIAFTLYKFIGQEQPKSALPASKIVPFTSFPGRELQPAFSPDGNQIAFAWDGEKGDNYDIYVKLNEAGTPPLRLTTNPADDLCPAWSPDGRHIAFSRVSKSERGIFIIPALGGPERKLSTTSVSERDFGISHLSWSPDGKLLAFSAPETPQEPPSIFLLSVETLEKRQLMLPPPSSNWGDQHPIFSPDGKTLAFARGASTHANDLYLVPAVGGEARRLTFDNQEVSGLDWTPDGREIIFSSNRGGGNNLWRIPASGGTPERLAAGGENGSGPTISRQGNRLAYAQSIRDSDIWRIELPNPAGKAPTRFIASTREDRNPQFSPDGKRIAFESSRLGSTEIWVCNSEGLNCAQLTSFGGPTTGTPRWSPTGERLAFDSIQEGNKDIYVVSVEGGKPRRLTTEDSDEVRPSWSRDGRWIYFGSNRTGNWQVWKAPAEGGQAVEVTKQGGREAFESPDGKFVYYTKGPDLTSIWRVAVEGGEEVQILDQVFQGCWAVLDRGIYFVNPRATPHQAIEFFSFATGQVTRIVTLEKLSGAGLTISPDGRWMLYRQVNQSGSDIMMVENFR